MNPDNLQNLSEVQKSYETAKDWFDISTLALTFLTLTLLYFSSRLAKAYKSKFVQGDKRKTSEKRIIDRFNKGLGILAALSALGAYLVGGKLSTSTTNLEALKDRVSNERIAASNAIAKVAQRGAAKANSESAKSTAIAERAKEDQKKLTLETRATSYSLTKANIRLSNAQRRQAEAELSLRKNVEEVRAKQAPRNISSQQRDKVLEILKVSVRGPIKFFIASSDDESIRYAEQIVNLLLDAGWQIDKSDIGNGLLLGGSTSGLILVVSDLKSVPLHAGCLFNAFTKAGIQIQPNQNPEVERGVVDPSKVPGMIQLIIGTKPKI